MPDSGTQPKFRPGGAPRTRAAVRDAAPVALARHGYRGLTVEGVADRCGVHRATVYRRWGGADGLVVDALDLAASDDWRPARSPATAGRWRRRC